MFRKPFFILICAAAVMLLPLVSCEVGLGQAVDTQPPTVKITYPPASAVIRDTFVLAGNCSDDTKVASVTVTVTNTDKGNTYSVPDVIVNNEKGTWSVNVNKKVGSGWSLSDGKYQAEAVATDAAGRVSGTSASSFEIDNTVPLFIISSPGSEDIADPTPYGTTFKISGTIADDHTIKAMDAEIFAPDGEKLITTCSSGGNVETAGGTSVVLAKYKQDGTAEVNVAYNTVYNSADAGRDAKNSDTHLYKCRVTLVDGAKLYQNSAETENNTTGNATTTVYLNDDIYATLMSTKNNGYGLEAGDLKKIINGTYSGSLASEDQNKVLSILNQNSKSIVAFSLNPDASPTYNVSAYSFAGTDITSAAQKNGKLTITASPGRDGTNIYPSTFKVYLAGPYVSLTQTDIDNFYADPENVNKNITAGITQLKAVGDFPSGSLDSSYTFAVTLPDRLTAKQYYLVAVTGADADELPLEPESYFGFVGAASEVPPQLTVTSPADGTLFGDSADVTFTGKLVSDLEIKSFDYVFTVINEATGKEVGTIKGSEAAGTISVVNSKTDGTTDETWLFNAKDGEGYAACSAAADSGKVYLYSLKITALDANGKTTTFDRNIQVDTACPVVKIKTVQPHVIDDADKKDCVNGTVTVSGKITENNLESVTLKVSDGTNEKTYDLGEVYDFEQEIDTTTYDDGKTLTFTLSAKDNAGNESLTAKTADNVPSVSYTIRQSTDNPVVNASNASAAITADGIKSGSNLFDVSSNKTLLGTVTDDDGLKSVTITAYANIAGVKTAIITAADLAKYGIAANPVNVDFTADSTTASIKYTLPSTEGKYIVEITAVDIEYDSAAADYAGDGDKIAKVQKYRTAAQTYNIAVDKGIPTLTVTTVTRQQTAANTAKDVKGTAADSSGLKSLYRYNVDSATDTIDTTKPEAKWVSGAADNTITFKSDSGDTDDTWKDTLSAEEVGTAEKTTKRYIATDIYNNTNTADFIYFVDAVPPTFKIVTPASAAVFDRAGIYVVTGTAKDNNSIGDIYFKVVKSGDTIPAVANNKYTDLKATWTKAAQGTSLDADGNTTWKANIDLRGTSYTDAVYTVYIAAYDAAGNESSADNSTVQLTADSVAPVITVTTAPAEYNKAAVTVKGTLAETNLEEFTASYSCKAVSDTPVTGTFTITGTSSWTFTIPATAGKYTITLTAKDKAGYSATKELTTTMDVSAPTFIDNPSISTSYLNNNTQTLTLHLGDTGTNGSVFSSGFKSVTYTLDSATGNMTQGGKYTGSASDTAHYNYSTTFSNLADGTHTVSITAVDNANNTVTAGPFTYKIDTTVPVISSVTPADTQINSSEKSSGTTITVAGSDATSGVASVTLYKGANTNTNLRTVTKTATAGNSSLAVSVLSSDLTSEGTNTFTVVETDAAGNTASGTVDISLDTVSPAVTYTAPAANATVNKLIDVSGKVTDATSGINTASGILQIYNQSAEKWETAVNAVGTSYTVSCAADGSWNVSAFNTEKYYDGVNSTNYDSDTAAAGVQFTLRARFSDKYGNTSTDTLKFTVDQNSDRPVVKLTNIDRTGSAIKLSKTVYGTITDDDGDVKGLWVTADSLLAASGTVPTTTQDNGWTKVAVDSGSWAQDAATEGHTEWYFYCIDNADTSFYTKAAAALSRLYINGKSENTNQDNSAAITFDADMTPPSVKLYISRDPANDPWTTSSDTFGGTTGKYLSIEAVVTEAVGMDTTSPAVLALNNSKPASSSSSGSTYTYIFGPIDMAAKSGAAYVYADGSTQLSVTVTDKSGQVGSAALNIVVDNTAPSAVIITPTTSVSDAVSAAVTVKGTSSDNSAGVSVLKYLIPSKAQITAGVTSSTAGWASLATSSTWEIAFTSGASDTTDSLLYYVNDTNRNNYVTATASPNIWQLPVYFYVQDKVGNEKIITDQYVLVDSDSGKPKAWINTPDEGSTTSGIVTIYGGASDNISVKEVRIQIDANDDGSFTAADCSYIKANWSGSEACNNLGSPTDDTWYITASGTNSWKRAINTNLIAVSTSDAAKKYMRIRVKAYDYDGNTRDWTSARIVTIDSQTPVIKDLKIVQYGAGNTSGTTVTEREYIAGMYVSNVTVSASGTWYLTGTITDNQQVKTITFETLTSSAVRVIPLTSTESVSNSTASYSLNLPLTTNESGQIYARIAVLDDTGNKTQQDIMINIDSTPPSLYKAADDTETTTTTTDLRLKSSDANVNATTNQVQNSNTFYTFGDTVNEAGSGMQYLAFYFKRTASGVTSVYDPMTSTGNKTTVAASKTAGSVYINSDGLAALYITGATRSAEDSLTLASLAGNTNIHAGGLIKIAGTYSKISEFNSSTGKITFTPTAAASFTEAEIIYAQVVDHMLTESIKSDNTTLVYDDGDGMVESINRVGSGYVWSASIRSDYIPDGPAEIHAVAIDAAGNLTHGSVTTYISNKRPRITKVLLGTDLNGNSKYDYYSDAAPVTSVKATERTAAGKEFGEFCYYPAIDLNSGAAKAVVTLASSSFKVKNGLCVLPEFTGANNSLAYTYGATAASGYTESDDSVETLKTTIATPTAMVTGTSLNTQTTTGSADTVGAQTSTWGGVVLASDKLTEYDDKTYYLAFTFWDATEGTTQGTTSQYALLKVPVYIDVTDTVKPTPTISPFYWNSAADNSLYGNSTANGHIELESDWANSEYKTGSTGEYDGDPKVSGKIRILGTAKDDTRLSTIALSFAGIQINGQTAGDSVVLATYSAGVWSYTNSAATVAANGWAFNILSDSISQAGHTATWELDVDTSKITNVAQLDKVIAVTSTDAKSNTSDAGSGNTASGALTPYYRVDVVPYITGVKTSLSSIKKLTSSVYDRTALGHYPVKADQKAYFYGFNLVAGATVSDSGTGTITLGASDSTTFAGYTVYPIAVSGLKSGNIYITVNNTISLNNKNSNVAKGAYTQTTNSVTGDYSVYSNYYNRQPNGENNNNLTDDVVLDIWTIKNSARSRSGTLTEPVMRISARDAANANDVMRFAFTNGAEYFSMAPASDSAISYQNWQHNYADFNNVAFTYDSQGNSYGITTGLDTYPDGTNTLAGRFTFVSSRWGVSNLGEMNDNYWGLNKLRLEAIGIMKGAYIQGATLADNYVMDTRRFNSPVLATAVHDTGTGTNASTTVYLAYYDKFQKQIRFRWGTFLAGNQTISTGEYHNTNGFGQFVDQHGQADVNSGTDYYLNNKHAFDAALDDYSLIAGKDAVNPTTKDTGNTAGKYVAIDVVPGANIAADVVVAVWYDGADLKYSYKLAPNNDYDANNSSVNAGKAGYWSKSQTIFTNGGKYCAIKVDAKKGIHIAAQDSINQDLKYAYLSSYNAAYSEATDSVTVDSYAIVGTQIQIDTELENGKVIPYISYYNGATEKPKMAYLVPQATMNYSAVGSDASTEMFTGNWEVTLIPTTSEVQDDHTNIGLWKTTAGVQRTATYKGTDTVGIDNGSVYGNGTANAVIGYATVVGPQGYIETAQKQ